MIEKETKETLTEAQKLELLCNGLLLQMVTKFKEQYKNLSNDELLQFYHEQEGIVEQSVKEFKDRVSIILDTIRELLKERGIKY